MMKGWYGVLVVRKTGNKDEIQKFPGSCSRSRSRASCDMEGHLDSSDRVINVRYRILIWYSCAEGV